jgi:hypothetical protein
LKENQLTITEPIQKTQLLIRRIAELLGLCIGLSARYNTSLSVFFPAVFRTYPAHVWNTFDVGAGAEEAAGAREDGKDGVRVVVQDAQGVDGVGDEVAAEGVEGFGAVELGELLVLYRCWGLFALSWINGSWGEFWKGAWDARKGTEFLTVMIPILPLISNLISVYEEVMMDGIFYVVVRRAGNKGNTVGNEKQIPKSNNKAAQETKQNVTDISFQIFSRHFRTRHSKLCPATGDSGWPRLGESWGFWGTGWALGTGFR